jgi:hypothetical protein
MTLTSEQAAALAAGTGAKLELEYKRLVEENKLRDSWNERTLDYEIHLVDYFRTQQKLIVYALARIEALEAANRQREGGK